MQTNKIVIITCDEPHKQMVSKRSQTQKRAYIVQFHVCEVQKQGKAKSVILQVRIVVTLGGLSGKGYQEGF